MAVVKIAGGGFTGLVSAYYFLKAGHQVVLFEKSQRLGGLLGSERKPWGLVESAANGFLASQKLIELCEDVGVNLVFAQRGQRKRFIYRSRPRQLPLGGLELTRFLAGAFVRAVPPAGKLAREWCENRFGYGATTYLIEPAVQGIFGTTLDRLSARLVYSYFFERKTARARRGLRGLCSPRNGMQEFVSKLADFLVNNGVDIRLNQEAQVSAEDILVATVPAGAAADLIESRDQWLADQLRRVRYLPLTTATLGFRQTARAVNGFGCLFPKVEKFNSLGVLFNDCIFPDRGPYKTETFIIDRIVESQTELQNLILQDRKRLHSLKEDEIPEFIEVKRWENALPLYDLELERILQGLHLPEKTFLAGNYLGHIGLTKNLEFLSTLPDKLLRSM